jgi:allantoin racemase
VKILIINPNTSVSITERIRHTAEQYVSNETLIEVVNVSFGLTAIEGHIDGAIAQIAVLEKLIEHMNSYDAAVIACAGDEALWAAREILEVPVVGIGEAAFYIACLIGYKFSVITTGGAKDVSIFWELIRRYGLESRCASVQALPVSVLGVLDKDITILVEKAVEDAVKAYGADVICLGCASMTGIDKLILGNTKVPIIDGIKEGVLLAEILCRSGLKTSKVGMFSRPTLNIFNGQPNMVNLKSWYTKHIGLEKKG